MLALLLCVLTDFAPNVESIEVNTTLDCHGTPRFTQAIFWDEWGRCRQWYMLEEKSKAHVYRAGDVYTVTWVANDQLRQVRSPRYKRTFTDFDPEEQDRSRWPIDRRKAVLP